MILLDLKSKQKLNGGVKVSECKTCTWGVVKNAASAGLRIVNKAIEGSTLFVTKEIVDQRRSICDGCEFKSSLRCKLCGCFIAAKTKLATEKCPKEKW